MTCRRCRRATPGGQVSCRWGRREPAPNPPATWFFKSLVYVSGPTDCYNVGPWVKTYIVKPVQVCFVHVFFVQVTILKLVWRSRRVDVPRCVHFPSDFCSVIQQGEITVEKCVHRGTSASHIVTWTKKTWT